MVRLSRQSASLMRSGIGRKVGLMLLVPFCGAIGAVLFFWYFLAQTVDVPAQVNLSGSQRMLAIQLGDWANMVAAGQEEDRARLRELVAVYERSLVVLERGGKSGGRDIAPVPDGPHAELAKLRAQWAELSPGFLAIANNPAGSPGFERATRNINPAVEALRADADDLTNALEDWNDAWGLRMQWVLGSGLGLNIILLVLGMWYAKRYFIKPVLAVDEAAKRISKGDFSVRLVCTTHDELCQLAKTVNGMAARLRGLLRAINLRRRYAETLAESLPLGTVLLDSGLAVLQTNRSFREMFNLADHESSGRQIDEVLPAVGLREQLVEAMGSGEALRRFELEFQSPAGVRSLLVAVAATRFAEINEENEEDARLLLVIEDRTKLEWLTRRVAEQEQQWRETVDAIADPIYMHDPHYNIVRANRAAVTLSGSDSDSESGLVGRRYYEALGLGQEPLASCLEAEHAGAPRSELLHDETTDRWYRIESHPNMGREGEYLGAVHVHFDITAVHRAEVDLRRSEQSFRTLIEQAPDAIAVHRDGRFVYVNPAMVRLLGCDSHAELIGQPVSAVIHSDGREVDAEEIRSMVGSGTLAPPREERFLRKDGSLIHAEVVSMPLDYKGEPSVVAIGRDLTARKELTARMMQMDRMIAVGTLAAGVGHEINNPLTYVGANVSYAIERIEGLQESAESISSELRQRFGDKAADEILDAAGASRVGGTLAEIREVLGDARDGSDRIRDVVRNLKTLSRGDDEKMVPLAVHKVIESAIDMAFNEIRHRARLVKDFGQVPHVHGNESRLAQVFLNLIVNAAHAIDEGAAERNEIRVRTFERDGKVAVEVRDTGKGIPNENLSRLFDPFFTTKPIGQGTGLGLSICRQIVETHGGRIEVESELGAGTVFRVLLPPAPDDIAPEPPTRSEPPQPGRRGRILVVDDEPMIVRIMEHILSKEHDVEAVTSARAALDRIRAGERFDLVFCDLMMPDMTGMDLYDAVCGFDPKHAERMIFMTGGAFTPRAQEFLDRTPNLHVEKPFNAKNLRALVRDLLK